MAIKAYKPTSAARRGMTTQDLGMVTHKKPVRSLLTVSYTHLTLPTNREV